MKPGEIRVGAVYAREGAKGPNLRKVVKIAAEGFPTVARSVSYLEIRGTGYVSSEPEICSLGAFARWAEREVEL